MTLKELAEKKGVPYDHLVKLVRLPTLTENIIAFKPTRYEFESDWAIWKLGLVLKTKNRTPEGLERILYDEEPQENEYWYNGFYSPLLWKLSQGRYSIFRLAEDRAFLEFVSRLPQKEVDEWFRIPFARIIGRVKRMKQGGLKW